MSLLQFDVHDMTVLRRTGSCRRRSSQQRRWGGFLRGSGKRVSPQGVHEGKNTNIDYISTSRYLCLAVHGELTIPGTRTIRYGPRNFAVWPLVVELFAFILRSSSLLLLIFHSRLNTALFSTANNAVYYAWVCTISTHAWNINVHYILEYRLFLVRVIFCGSLDFYCVWFTVILKLV